MDALSEYFVSKHYALELKYKDDCLTIARDIARLLLDQGKQPYIVMLEMVEQRGVNRFHWPIMPLKYRCAVIFTKHYVCCCDDQAFDPINPEPLKIAEYSNTLFGIVIPMQVFVPSSEIKTYLAGLPRKVVRG